MVKVFVVAVVLRKSGFGVLTLNVSLFTFNPNAVNSASRYLASLAWRGLPMGCPLVVNSCSCNLKDAESRANELAKLYASDCCEAELLFLHDQHRATKLINKGRFETRIKPRKLNLFKQPNFLALCLSLETHAPPKANKCCTCLVG